VLNNSLDVLNRITGNSNGSLGLHTAIYFYNDKGKHSKFLFLGVIALIADKLRNNDFHFFKKFTKAHPKIEDFLIENKSLIGIILQNLGKTQRIPKIKELFDYMVAQAATGASLRVEEVVSQLGLTGRILDIRTIQTSPNVTDETKNTILIKTSIASAPKCPLCNGRLEPNKSVSYDHKVDKKNDGTGNLDNIQLAHFYCNNSKDALL
jgi:HNH endonuclease